MTDIVERLLLKKTLETVEDVHVLFADAADEIERLREALQQCLHVVQAEIDCCKNDTTAWYRLCFATLDKARAALGEKE